MLENLAIRMFGNKKNNVPNQFLTKVLKFMIILMLIPYSFIVIAIRYV